MKQLDVLFVNANSSAKTYQGLSDKFSAIEPPTHALMLANACHKKSFGVDILDSNAERLTDEETVLRIKEINPRLVCFIAMGSNPNTSTTLMSGISSVCKLLKSSYPEYKTCVGGSHPNALPREALEENSFDFVLLNEGVYALQNLLRTDLKTDLSNVKGIGWKDNGKITLNTPERIVPHNLMDIDFPNIGEMWNLLPYKEKRLDMYRSCDWHANFIEQDRQPYAALFSSLGCFKSCSFCLINILNRTNNADNISAADSPIMRFWTPEFMIKEFDRLIEMGVTTIRISDEMFLFNKKYYEPLCKLLVERNYGDKLKIWVYSRCDTVNARLLDLVRKAGITWIALGIESSDPVIRREASKGSFEDCKVKDIVNEVQNAGINVIANYIYGLEGETHESMQKTFDFSMDLLTPEMNCYPAMALKGSPLYLFAKSKGYDLPDCHEGYSFHSYECLPLRTDKLTAAEILKFRDEAWQKYHTDPAYLSLIENKFGVQAREHIQETAKIKLKRKILGD